MTFQEFDRLNFRAKEAGVGDCPALKELRCYIQAENLAQRGFGLYLSNMHELQDTQVRIVSAAIERSKDEH